MKVIGAGFGRTGTSSLKVALEELGFGPCYHMSEVMRRPRHIALWQAAVRGEPVDWTTLFAGFQATVDWPASAFYAQLMEIYPDAKVLLSVRDPERWYESTRNSLYRYRIRRHAVSRLGWWIIGIYAPSLQQSTRMINALVWDKVFGGCFQDRHEAIAVFERHIQEVKERVPAERLLVYDVKEGWVPLCAFLNVAVPEGKPFPHVHDADAVRTLVRRRVVRTVTVPLAVVAVAILAAFLYRRSRPA